MMNNNNIVIDNGTYSIKYGLSSYEEPKIIKTSGFKEKNSLTMFNSSSSINPIECGVINNWNSIENIWSNILNELPVLKNECNVLLTESINSPKNQKEKIAEIMFEKFNVNSISVQLDSFLSLYSSGKNTGMVVDLGHSSINIIPYNQGEKLTKSVKQLKIGGRTINNYLYQLLNETNVSIDNDQSILNDMKEKLASISLSSNDVGSLYQCSKPTTFELPNGNTIYLNNNQHLLCSELLFSPDLMDLGNIRPIHEAIKQSIDSCDIDIRGDLYKSIMLFGGLSMLPGLSDRIENELKSLSPKSNIQINLTHDRNYSSFIGGTAYCDELSSNNKWITKSQFNELGSSVFNK